MTRWMWVALVALGVGCSGANDDGTVGPSVEMQVATTGLVDPGDVVWDVEVVNGASPAEVVWQQRLASTAYGAGDGDVSFVGPCDPGAGENVVKLWLVGVYADYVTDAGAFAAGSASGAGAVVGTPVEHPDPTADGPLTQTFPCMAGQDVFVQFDVDMARTSP